MHKFIIAVLAGGITFGAANAARAIGPVAATVAGNPVPATNLTSISPYAGDGYYLFATGPSGGRFGVNIGTDISRLPGYVSTLTQPTADEASGFGYASVATPLDGTVTTGTITDGTNADKFSFTAGPTVPASFTIGLLVDNLDGTGYNAASLSVTSTTTGATAATVNELAGNQQPDLYFFTITGASSGETFNVGATQGTNGTATIAGITFAAVPEPTSLGILAVGSVGLMIRRRRRPI